MWSAEVVETVRDIYPRQSPGPMPELRTTVDLERCTGAKTSWSYLMKNKQKILKGMAKRLRTPTNLMLLDILIHHIGGKYVDYSRSVHFKDTGDTIETSEFLSLLPEALIESFKLKLTDE
jgi:hypothetical protein